MVATRYYLTCIKATRVITFIESFGNVPAIANTKDCFRVTTLHTSHDAAQFNAT